MVNNTLQKPLFRMAHYFYLFVIIHVVVWTLTPSLIRLNLPLDAMEGTTWGHQLEWGYDKNPFVNAWLTMLATQLDGMSGLATYFFSQLSVALALCVVWKLGKRMFSQVHALFAVLLLESVQYFNLHAIDFNDNTLEVGFWAMTIFYFYHALQQSSWRNWLLTGFFAGISMMIKYYTVMLLISMLLFLLASPANRLQLRTLAFYGGIIVFITICIPHTLWLFSHEFVTIQYAIGRVNSPPSAWNHLFFPAQFAWQQIETFLPVVFLSLFIIHWQNLKRTLCPTSGTILRAFSQKKKRLSLDFDRWFLLIIGLGPFILTVLLSVITGIKLRAAWGQPLLLLWSLILVASIKPFIATTRIFYFFILTLCVMGLMAGSYAIALIKAEEPSSANFPGKIIAQQLTHEWHQKYHQPLRFVAGSRWLAGNIAFYSSDRPSVYIDWNKQFSPWINETRLKQSGALFVWDLSENHLVSFESIKSRFPGIRDMKLLHYDWLRNPKMAPVQIRVAFLPPAANSSV
jgi:4-amino-4-deoxy-L-arabinose transferase-like glycosyltransferase